MQYSAEHKQYTPIIYSTYAVLCSPHSTHTVCMLYTCTTSTVHMQYTYSTHAQPPQPLKGISCVTEPSAQLKGEFPVGLIDRLVNIHEVHRLVDIHEIHQKYRQVNIHEVHHWKCTLCRASPGRRPAIDNLSTRAVGTDRPSAPCPLPPTHPSN